MALNDIMSGTSSTFTDLTGNSVTAVASKTHSLDSNGYAEQAAYFNQGETINYTFSGGQDGNGVQGLAVSVVGTEIGDTFDFVINGTDVNLQTLIDNGEAQIVSVTELPFTLNTLIDQDGEVNSAGDLTSAADDRSTSIISFNFPIQTLSVSNTGTGTTGETLEFIDLYIDDQASPCFTRDTMIDTDQGEVAVQDLEAGMMVRTRDNGMQPVRWIGMKPTKDRAVRIKAGVMGNTRDLVVSPRHRMVLDGWQLQMLFDHDHALVTALELVNDDTIVRDAMTDVEYYHVMFDQHEVIFAEGAATESFHPDQASMGSMDAASRAEILTLFPDLRDGNTRTQAAPNLSATQAAYVAKNMGDFVS